MIKKIILILCMFLILPSYGETILTGGIGIDYNVNTAREELLNTPVKRFNPYTAALNITDKNNQENCSYFLQGNVKLKDRTLAFFSDSTYALMYNSNQYQVFYYSKNGKLMHIEIKDGLNYPYKSYKYTLRGELVSIALRVSREEAFIYNPDGTLIAHWLGKNAYDEKGNVIMSRKYAY